MASAVAVTLSVVYAWDWTLIGYARAGVTALFVLSYPSCIVAQAAARSTAAIRHDTTWGPFLVIATGLGAAALVVLILGATTNSVTVLVSMAIVVVAISVVTTGSPPDETRASAVIAGRR